MKFTIAIPAYKAKFLDECIVSILSQTYDDFEVVIVNDASPEDLISIVNKFNDSRIRYYANDKNCGSINVVDNWNKCLSYAKGDYIICMGDDDRLLPDCLNNYVKLIETYPGLGVYHTWTEIMDENSNVIAMQEPRPIFESVYSMMWGRWKGRLQFIGDFLFECKRLRANGGFFKMPLAWASDDISAYIAAQASGIANTQIPGFQYRVNSLSITKSSNALIKMEAILLEENYYNEFLLKLPDKTNVTDGVFRLMLKKYQTKFIQKKKIFTISEDIKGNYFHSLKYIKERKHFKIDLSIIVLALIKAIYENVNTKLKSQPIH